MKIRSEFFIHNMKFDKYIDLSVDFYLKATKFKKGSIERKICFLKRKLYRREAMKHLSLAVKLLEKSYNEI